MNRLEVARAYVPYDDGVLLVRRANCSTNNSFWELPGGKVEPGQNALDAAVAETEQETGLLIEPFTEAIPFTSYPITEGKYAGRLYTASYVMARVIGGTLLANTCETDAITVMDPYSALEQLPLVDKSATVLRRVLNSALVNT